LKTPVGDTLVEEWVGLRPMVYDDLPIIDRTPGHNNLFVASGHGMIGLSTATATGKLLAELVTGQTPFIDPTPFGIRRFE
jgi:D-amino-acid dehydrogenase